jgi:hypothetical protein
MGFPRGRAPAPARSRGAVFAVGRRVYVACAGDGSDRVILTDEAGKKPLASLGDGTEVAIVAWRPGWAGGTQYRVRATDSGLEGRLAVSSLRSTAAAASAVPLAPAPVIRPAAPRIGESGRRLDQFSPLSRRPTGSMPLGTSPAPVPPLGGGEARRRFGQRSD